MSLIATSTIIYILMAVCFCIGWTARGIYQTSQSAVSSPPHGPALVPQTLPGSNLNQNGGCNV